MTLSTVVLQFFQAKGKEGCLKAKPILSLFLRDMDEVPVRICFPFGQADF